MKTLKKGFAARVLSMLLVAIMIISLGTVGLSSVSAAEVEIAESGYNLSSGTIFIFDNTYAKMISSTIQLMVGHDNYSKGYKMSKVANTNLYTTTVTDSWGDATQFCIFGVSGSSAWGPEGTNNISHRKPYASESTNIYNMGGNFSGTFLLTTDTTGKTLTPAHQTSGYSLLNHSQTVYVYGAESDNAAYTANGAAGTVTASGYYLTSATATSTRTDSTTATDYTSNLTYARSSNVKFTATPAEGYEFVGWSNSASESAVFETSSELNCTVQDAGKYYALFKKDAYTLDVNASASATEVFAGTDVTITASASDATANVTYILKDSQENTVDENTSGILTIDTSALTAGSYKYKVVASATVEGVLYTAVSEEITITVKAFEGFAVTPVYPTTGVECGDYIDITVIANTDYEVTYVLKDGAGVEIGRNTQGVFSVATTTEDKNTTKNFTVEATTTVNGQEYTAPSVSFSVNIVPISNTVSVNLYFKSSSTYGFAPIATVTGMFETLTDVEMEPAIYIGSNKTNTADYWWYKVTTKVSETNPNISFNVKSSRYDMEVTAYLTLEEGVTDYYFGVDNLYYTSTDNDIVNLTHDENKNFFDSAVHMIYDPKYDSEEALADVSSRYVLADIGDVNCDGEVNIKDATAIQKSLANLTTLSNVGNKVSDFDGDKAVTIKDATAIQKMLVASL